GAAANSASSVGQPCTNFRYAITEHVTAAIAMVSASIESGQLAMVATVSGVTEEPREMPRITYTARANGGGTYIGRPESAAADTPTIAPESQPAGMPARPRKAAPT